MNWNKFPCGVSLSISLRKPDEITATDLRDEFNNIQVLRWRKTNIMKLLILDKTKQDQQTVTRNCYLALEIDNGEMAISRP